MSIYCYIQYVLHLANIIDLGFDGMSPRPTFTCGFKFIVLHLFINDNLIPRD